MGVIRSSLWHEFDAAAPSLRTAPFGAGTADSSENVLTDRQRATLLAIAARLTLPPRMTLYTEGTPARWVFVAAEGVVKTLRELPSGKRRILGFLFPRDLFGLAERGRYVNTARTITRVVLFRLPLDTLRSTLERDSALNLRVLCKVTDALRRSQRQAIMVGRRDAPGRLAMFLLHIRDHAAADAAHPDHVALPMSRSDIADFLGLSAEAVSRATRALERQRLVEFDGRHLVRIVNPSRLAKLAGRL